MARQKEKSSREECRQRRRARREHGGDDEGEGGEGGREEGARDQKKGLYQGEHLFGGLEVLNVREVGQPQPGCERPGAS